MRKKLLLICFISALTSEAIGFGDIVFSEIMADPEPTVGLPDQEYIELYNRTQQSIDLSDWTFIYDAKKYTFPESRIESYGYLLLCSKNSRSLVDLLLPVAAFSSFPVLANTGKTLSLVSPEGNLIGCVEYKDTWYGSGFKGNGGWSLECIDSDNLSGESDNWTASEDSSGGSPGRQNTVKRTNPDLESPVCSRLYVLSPETMELHFSKSMDPLWLSSADNFFCTHGSNMVIGVQPVYPACRQAMLNLSDMLTSGATHELIIRGMTDISGNIAPDTSLYVSLPVRPDSFDLSLNELMFNPASGGRDYVEVVNRSGNCLDLSVVWLTNRNASGELNKGSRLSEKPIPCMPGSYWILSDKEDSLKLEIRDSLSHLLTLTNMPSMPDDAGNLVLLTISGSIIDEVSYKDDWHFVLMSDKEGVSLEKTHPNRPSNRKDSWLSASSLSGYGTPGLKNSQYQEELTSDNFFLSIGQNWLSPDNDGLDDVVCIRLIPPEPGTVNLTLFDLNGRIVRHLLRNKWTGSDDQVCWDGTNEAGTLLPFGRYVLLATHVTPTGKTQKKRLVLSILL